MLLLTNYLFMDNPKEDKKVGERAILLSRFTCLALGLKNRSVLHCIGLWLAQQSNNSEALKLMQNVNESYIDLVKDPWDSLNTMPNISPVFAINFMSSITELFTCPQQLLVEICAKWMEESWSKLLAISGNVPSLIVKLFFSR
jgi:hypothetical protein